jgi:lipid A 3-O-deacylase
MISWRNFIYKLIDSILIFVLFLIGISQNSYGFSDGNSTEQPFEPGIEIELEYLYSCDSARNIDTLSLNILKASSGNDRVSFYKGITITRAYGNITHLGVVSNSSAFGIGPVYMLRYKLKQWNQSTFSLDMSGGLIIYSEDFPAGGDFYNFMWRIGPKYTCHIGDNCLLNIEYKIMHVSNGQWSGSVETSHNPAYNASGFSLSIATPLN